LHEAVAAFEEAIRLKPNFPEAHYNLGVALMNQRKWPEAEVACKEAIRLQPTHAEAHCNLGHALRDQGRFSEALQSLRRGHALGISRPDWPYPSRTWVRNCRRLIELDRKLPAVLNGNADPASAAERLELASLCQMSCKHLHATAVRFAAEAFAADSKLADDLQEQYRYNAACSAVLAAAGQAEDARLLPDKIVLHLQQQARRWLQADLALYARLARHNDPRVRARVQQRLTRWQKGTDLASVRDPQGARPPRRRRAPAVAETVAERRGSAPQSHHEEMTSRQRCTPWLQAAGFPRRSASAGR
jgi:tetratricopeptide (TPR) repeat protein